MKRQTIRDLRAALGKQPHERTDAEVALVERFESKPVDVTESLKKHAQNLKAVARPDAIDKVLEQIVKHQSHATQDMVRNFGGDPLRRFGESLLEEARATAREKAERLWREEQMVTHLAGINERLHIIAAALERHEAMLQEHDEQLIRFRSGVSGRPSSMHLILEELRRRGLSGDLEITQAEQARVLCKWLARTHRMAPRPTPKAVTNNLEFRESYRSFRPKPPRRS